MVHSGCASFLLCLWLPIDLSRGQHSRNRVKLIRISCILLLFQRVSWHRFCCSRWACMLSITAIQLKKKSPDDLTEILKNRPVLEYKRVRGTGQPPPSSARKMLSPKALISGLSHSSRILSMMRFRWLKHTNIFNKENFCFITHSGRCLPFAGSHKLDFQLAKTLPCAKSYTTYGAKMATSATRHMFGFVGPSFCVCLYSSWTTQIFTFLRNMLTLNGTQEMISPDWQPDEEPLLWHRQW